MFFTPISWLLGIQTVDHCWSLLPSDKWGLSFKFNFWKWLRFLYQKILINVKHFHLHQGSFITWKYKYLRTVEELLFKSFQFGVEYEYVGCVLECGMCVSIRDVCKNLWCVWVCGMCVSMWDVCEYLGCVWVCGICVYLGCVWVCGMCVNMWNVFIQR